MNHPWHDISIGEKVPEVVNVIIEIPKGSRAKYELDKNTGLLKLDRVLYSSVYYPSNYGFIPQTLAEDNDPLDIMVLSQINFEPLSLVRAKVIGVMRLIDTDETDDKIIAVANDDISVNTMNDIEHLNDQFIRELVHFFEEYKRLEHKPVTVDKFEDRDIAFKIINESIKRYQGKFPGSDS